MRYRKLQIYIFIFGLFYTTFPLLLNDKLEFYLKHDTKGLICFNRENR